MPYNEERYIKVFVTDLLDRMGSHAKRFESVFNEGLPARRRVPRSLLVFIFRKEIIIMEKLNELLDFISEINEDMDSIRAK